MKGKTEDVARREREAQDVLYSDSAYVLCTHRVTSGVARIACPRARGGPREVWTGRGPFSVWQRPRYFLWFAKESGFFGHVCLHPFHCVLRFAVRCVLSISWQGHYFRNIFCPYLA